MYLGPDVFSACGVLSVRKWLINGCNACVQVSDSCSIVFSKLGKYGCMHRLLPTAALQYERWHMEVIRDL